MQSSYHATFSHDHVEIVAFKRLYFLAATAYMQNEPICYRPSVRLSVTVVLRPRLSTISRKSHIVDLL